jgi:hypothetical protein
VVAAHFSNLDADRQYLDLDQQLSPQGTKRNGGGYGLIIPAKCCQPGYLLQHFWEVFPYNAVLFLLFGVKLYADGLGALTGG